MRGSILAVIVVAVVAISSAIDEECIQRKVRGLPVHWPNPTNCSSFYRCTNKSIKRELLCPEGKEYNPNTGRCASKEKNLCKLSLIAPLSDISNPCNGEISGTFVPNAESCRGFNICNNNMAYPQICSDGSYFNQNISACEPDTELICWENLCVNKKDGVYVANANDCYSFYICYDQRPTPQTCPDGSYFNNENLNCMRGKCPSDTTCTTEATTSTPICETKITTTTCAAERTTKSYIPEIINDQCNSSICINAVDGFVYPAQNTNSGFCVCIGEKSQYRECFVDNIFNEALNICVAKDTMCPSSKCKKNPDYTTFPAANTTVGFCRCLNKEATYHVCTKNNYIYNAELGYCVNPVQKLCKGGYNEGDFIPNPDNRMFLYICFDGELVEISCEIGNYYDDQIKVCLPDTEGKCPECHQALPANDNRRSKRSIQRTPRCLEGSRIPAGDCDKYYKCSNGVQVVHGCGKYKYFNIETLTCDYDMQHNCWPTTNCNPGDKTPHPNDCDKYYECCSGIEKLKECGENYYFNKVSKTCTFDNKHICWPKEPCTCPGGYNEGDISAHPNECDKYYICTGGKQVLQECGEGNYFNTKNMRCELDVNNVCPSKKPCTCPGGYKEGEMSAHPQYCNKYYICTDGKQILHECGEDNYFNNITLTCELDIYNECLSKLHCTCPGGYEEGEFSAHSTDCNKYYICHDGHQILQDCGTDNYFNNDTLICEPDIYHICWPNLCVGKPKGTLVANPQQCNSFYLCKDDDAIPGSCYEGEWFDPAQFLCVPDFEAKCYNPCENKTEVTVSLLPHPICNKYYFCDGGKTFVGECFVGSFDVNTHICNETKLCNPNPCKGKPNYFTFPYQYDPTKFYMCNMGEPILKQCLLGTEFDIEYEICLPVSNRDCPTCPDMLPNSFPTLDDNNDREYCYCYQGIAYKSECSNGYIFNPDIGTCYSNAPCDPGFCVDKIDYTVTINRNCSKSFCMCINQKPIIVKCPNNSTFNPYINECTNIEISPECDQASCKDKTDGELGEFINDKIANGLCICRGQIATFESCPIGSKYNPTLKICQLQEINCNSKLCKGLDDGTKIPSVTTMEGYCKCLKGEAIYYNCPDNGIFNIITAECDAHPCPLAKCVKPGTTFKPSNSTDGICVCSKNSVKYIPCENGQLFSEIYNICTDKCTLNLCTDKPGLNIPSAISKHNYCTCDGRGNAVFKVCDPQYYSYNMAEQKCIPDVKTLCTKQCNANYEAYEANGTLDGYCMCTSSGEVIFQTCGNDKIFNPNRGICVSTAKSVCNVNYCKGATINHPITMPALDGNKNVFCYCSSSTDVMVLTCPSDKEYLHERRMCVHKQKRNFACPDINSGDKIADNMMCNMYFICINGKMESKMCPTGQYFNENIGECHIDTNDICSSKSDCLGAFHEGELLRHPVYEFMYYMCKNNVLHEYNCPMDEVFSSLYKQCIPRNLKPRKLSAADSMNNNLEVGCLNNEMRSVPSNCSQYEVCINQNWKRKTCPNYRYYNPKHKKCLEPQDDFQCSYARITSLPACEVNSKYQIFRAKSCSQYYRCQNGKWRLKSCEHGQYFNVNMSTCLSILQDPQFQCETTASITITKLKNEESTIATTCQHLSQRYYSKNCAMYLICLDNDWWYQYCPVSMYFNRSLNYCVPDVDQVCGDVIKSQVNFNAEEYSKETCQQDGLLRPSALACNRYFVCLSGKWQKQHCSYQEFYDVTNARCSPDVEGQCAMLNRDCLANEKRAIPRNCSLYEQCSIDGKWLKFSCAQNEIFDELLQQCITNQGICSVHGLKRACKPNETVTATNSCSMFYYCSMDSWHLGSCLKGFMYSVELKMCVPHQPKDQCRPLLFNESNGIVMSSYDLCQGKLDGILVPHPKDCSRYYICIQQTISQEMQCPRGSYFEATLGYCQPNNGNCHLPLTGVCANATDELLVPHPTDCQAFYRCSSFNGIELLHCPLGEYFHNQTHQCQTNNGECKKVLVKPQKCSDSAHGIRFAHDTYCNIYYACVKGLAIPIECPDNYNFSTILAKCVLDKEQHCQRVQLVDDTLNYNCDNLSDGSYLPDRKDCTRYYICSQGQALPKKCANSSYFDGELLLCVPDDGSCPYVNVDASQYTLVPPNSTVCDGKHGYLMVDPLNCNNFYVCINNRLKHERCYSQQFFNTTSKQCQKNTKLESSSKDLNSINTMPQCLDETTSITKLCKEMDEGTSIAEPGDCRRYITCQEADEEPLSKRCRNGESFDSLLGFCRQNDGTCLMENGQRVGECSGKHGQLARDPKSCRHYFVCINGQKISQICKEDEYFNKSQNTCLKDTQHICSPTQPLEESYKPSCVGLSESILYPNINDNCRSYFQCKKGEAKFHKCADDLFFDPITIKCVQNKTKCIMPTQTIQRSSIFSQNFKKLCANKTLESRYANIDNDCRSFYICHASGEITHELCPLGKKYNEELNICFAENKTMCS